MTEQANNGEGCGIVRQGYQFGKSKKGEQWKVLAEGNGVVVVRQDEGFVAYDVAARMDTEKGETDLRQNLAGAKINGFGGGKQAYLVVRRKSQLSWHTKMPPPAAEKVATGSGWRQKRFHLEVPQPAA